MEKKSKELIGKNIGQYKIIDFIASGSFGSVYKALDEKTNEHIAMKIPIKEKEKNADSLIKEYNFYKHANKVNVKNIGIPNVKLINYIDDKIMIMDLLGLSLENILLKNYKKQFKLKTIILLTIKMIEIIKFVHDLGYIHRDIKADNFVMDVNNNKLYLIDYGLTMKYITNKKHYPFSNDKKFCGTARYASIAAHKGETQSRKDDLESIIYVLIYLFKGDLPWMYIKHKEKCEKYRLIKEKKLEVTDEQLCEQLPREFLVFLKSVKSLDFDEKPLYNSYIKMFKKLYDSKHYTDDNLEF